MFSNATNDNIAYFVFNESYVSHRNRYIRRQVTGKAVVTHSSEHWSIDTEET